MLVSKVWIFVILVLIYVEFNVIGCKLFVGFLFINCKNCVVILCKLDSLVSILDLVRDKCLLICFKLVWWFIFVFIFFLICLNMFIWVIKFFLVSFKSLWNIFIFM